jgi:hypothetical protein
MNGARPARGGRLQAIAEHIFDRTTLDRVVLPALADLQHECSASVGGALSRRLICWRAYWSVWKTFGICLVINGMRDRHGISGMIARRTAACLAGLLPVLILPGLIEMVFSSGPPFTMAFSAHPRFALGEALKATLLLLPQALLACLPAAFFFALVLYRKEERPDGATVIPTVIAGTVICVILVSVLSALVVPTANDAYQSLAFETQQRRARAYALRPPPEPAKGVSEMTWWELRDQSTQAADTTAQARAAARLQEHLAFVALVPVLALLGYALSNRGRSRRAMFAVALALQTLYYVCFSLALTKFAQPYLYSPWVVNGVFLLLASLLLRSVPFSRANQA